MNPLLSLAVVIACSAWTCHAGEVSFSALAHRQRPPSGCASSPPPVSFSALARRQPAPAVVSSAPVTEIPLFQTPMLQPQWSGVTYSYPASTYQVQCFGNSCRLVKSK